MEIVPEEVLRLPFPVQKFIDALNKTNSLDIHRTYGLRSRPRSPIMKGSVAWATRGLLATDHVILNHGQVTWTTPELAPPHTTPTEGRLNIGRFNVHRCPTRRVFSGIGLKLVTSQATIRYLYHSATAATFPYWRQRGLDCVVEVIATKAFIDSSNEESFLLKLTVWCALWAGGIIGPYFFKNDEGHNVTVNGDRYRAMITNFFIPELNNHDVQELWFQQDCTTCHTARATINLLKDTLGDRLISRFGPVNWPPRSCDLTPLDYFL
ncbi:putative DD41D transposase [Trichonephila clavipes]|nr:putative DD41D transposase [Trichonephila clavipes]